jgi:hypothetical protein
MCFHIDRGISPGPNCKSNIFNNIVGYSFLFLADQRYLWRAEPMTTPVKPPEARVPFLPYRNEKMDNGGNPGTEYFKSCFLRVRLWISRTRRVNERTLSKKCSPALPVRDGSGPAWARTSLLATDWGLAYAFASPNKPLPKRWPIRCTLGHKTNRRN